jgi:hypothetical protein
LSSNVVDQYGIEGRLCTWQAGPGGIVIAACVDGRLRLNALWGMVDHVTVLGRIDRALSFIVRSRLLTFLFALLSVVGQNVMGLTPRNWSSLRDESTETVFDLYVLKLFGLRHALHIVSARQTCVATGCEVIVNPRGILHHRKQ